MITPNDIVACICEGNSEKYLISMLLEQNKLIFVEEQLLDGDFFQGKYRNPEVFSSQYLTMDYGSTKIVVLSIQDNKNSYHLKKPYSNKIKNTHLVVTSPELEILMIHSLGLYDQYQRVKKSKKPSVYLAETLNKKTSIIKSQDYIREFYSKYSLEDAIIMQKRKSRADSKMIFLADLLKSKNSL